MCYSHYTTISITSTLFCRTSLSKVEIDAALVRLLWGEHSQDLGQCINFLKEKCVTPLAGYVKSEEIFNQLKDMWVKQFTWFYFWSPTKNV